MGIVFHWIATAWLIWSGGFLLWQLRMIIKDLLPFYRRIRIKRRYHKLPDETPRWEKLW